MATAEGTRESCVKNKTRENVFDKTFARPQVKLAQTRVRLVWLAQTRVRLGCLLPDPGLRPHCGVHTTFPPVEAWPQRLAVGIFAGDTPRMETK